MCAKRNDETRYRILESAADEVHQSGFQQASLNRILERVGVTKGAFYHYFQSKSELGYALVEEVLKKEMRKLWLDPMLQSTDPVNAFMTCLKRAREERAPELLRFGCPINNLAQEMSSCDEQFREKICALYEEWVSGLARAFEEGQENGYVRKDVHAKSVALFIVAALEGSIGLAKNAQSLGILDSAMPGMLNYIQSLRPESSPENRNDR